MTCGQCKKLLTERTVATKVKKIGGETIVLAERQALVCDDHGVVAWDPVHPVSYPVVPYTPWVQPVIRPWPVTVQPWTTTPKPYPYTVWNQAGANGGNYQQAITVTSTV